MRDRARALLTTARPKKDNFRKPQAFEQFWRQLFLAPVFGSSKPEGPIETPNTLTLAEDHCNATGGSPSALHPSNQRPLHFPKFSLETEPHSKRLLVAKVAPLATSDVTITDVSSAHWKITAKGMGAPGREIPTTAGLARMLQARTSARA